MRRVEFERTSTRCEWWCSVTTPSGTVRAARAWLSQQLSGATCMHAGVQRFGAHRHIDAEAFVACHVLSRSGPHERGASIVLHTRET